MAFLVPLITSLAGPLLGGLMGKSSSQSGTTNQTESGTKDTKSTTLDPGTTTALTQSIMALLGSDLGGTLGGVTDAAGAAAGPNKTKFDQKDFVTKTEAAANSEIDSGLTADVNSLFSSLGSKSGSNTMAALLKGKLSNEAAAKKAGVAAQTEAAGAQINEGVNKSSVDTQVDATNPFLGLISSLLQGVKGASITESSTTNGVTSGTSAQSGSTFGFDGSTLGKFISGIGTAKY